MKKVLEPTGDNVIITIVEKEKKEKNKTASGIIIPTLEDDMPSNIGIIESIGEGRLLNNGEYAKANFEIGDNVIFNAFAGTKITLEEKDYLIMKSSDIIAKIKEL